MAEDLGRIVGKESYPWPHDFIEEARVQGVSLAVSKASIPDYDPGKTRLALAHPRAIVTVTADRMILADLAIELVREYVVGSCVEPTPEHRAELIARWSDPGEPLEWDLAYAYDKLMVVESDQDGIKWANTLAMCFWLREADKKKDLKRLEKKYGIEYQIGWLGFTFLTNIQYVARDDEEELPLELIGKGVEIVKVVYEDMEG